MLGLPHSLCWCPIHQRSSAIAAGAQARTMFSRRAKISISFPAPFRSFWRQSDRRPVHSLNPHRAMTSTKSNSAPLMNGSESNAPLRILHVEDSDLDAELVSEALAQDEVTCEIRRATNRAEFESALAANLPDIILSDYAVPGFDGL